VVEQIETILFQFHLTIQEINFIVLLKYSRHCLTLTQYDNYVHMSDLYHDRYFYYDQPCPKMSNWGLLPPSCFALLFAFLKICIILNYNHCNFNLAQAWYISGNSEIVVHDHCRHIFANNTVILRCFYEFQLKNLSSWVIHANAQNYLGAHYHWIDIMVKILKSIIYTCSY